MKYKQYKPPKFAAGTCVAQDQFKGSLFMVVKCQSLRDLVQCNDQTHCEYVEGQAETPVLAIGIIVIVVVLIITVLVVLRLKALGDVTT